MSNTLPTAWKGVSCRYSSSSTLVLSGTSSTNGKNLENSSRPRRFSPFYLIFLRAFASSTRRRLFTEVCLSSSDGNLLTLPKISSRTTSSTYNSSQSNKSSLLATWTLPKQSVLRIEQNLSLVHQVSLLLKCWDQRTRLHTPPKSTVSYFPKCSSPTHNVAVFSFGMIIFELLTLQLPYHDVKHSWKISQLIIDGVPPSLPPHTGAPRYLPLVQLFHKCTARNPFIRPNATRLRSKLKSLAQEGDSSMPPTSP